MCKFNTKTCFPCRYKVLYLLRHEFELDVDDRNWQFIPCCFKSMPHYIIHVNWRVVNSQQCMDRCFQWLTDLETAQTKVALEYLVYFGRSEHDVQNMACVGLWQAMKRDTTTRHQMSEMNQSAFKLPSI